MQYNEIVLQIRALKHIQPSGKGRTIRSLCLSLNSEEYLRYPYLMLYLIYLINTNIFICIFGAIVTNGC